MTARTRSLSIVGGGIANTFLAAAGQPVGKSLFEADMVGTARALLEHTEMAPEQIVEQALRIAGDLCIYTNQHHTIEVLE